MIKHCRIRDYLHNTTDRAKHDQVKPSQMLIRFLVKRRLLAQLIQLLLHCALIWRLSPWVTTVFRFCRSTWMCVCVLACVCVCLHNRCRLHFHNKAPACLNGTLLAEKRAQRMDCNSREKGKDCHSGYWHRKRINLSWSELSFLLTLWH